MDKIAQFLQKLGLN